MTTNGDLYYMLSTINANISAIHRVLTQEKKFEETDLTDRLRNRGYGVYTRDGIKHKIYQVLYVHRPKEKSEVPKPVAVMSMEEEDLKMLRRKIDTHDFVFAAWDTVYIYLD